MTAATRSYGVPLPVVAGVAITLIVEAFAIPTFFSWADSSVYSGPTWIWQVAAGCGAAAALCATGTLAGIDTARQLLLGLATISFTWCALFLPLLVWFAGMIGGELAIVDAIFMTTSAIVLVLLSRPQAQAWPWTLWGNLHPGSPRPPSNAFAVVVVSLWSLVSVVVLAELAAIIYHL